MSGALTALLAMTLLGGCQRRLGESTAGETSAGDAGDAVPAGTLAPILPVASALLLDPNAACRHAYACTYDGRCALADNNDAAARAPGGECMASDDASCEASRGCRDWGACHAQRGQCLAGSDEQCEKAWICRTKGFCHHDQGRCVVASDRDCKRSELCQYARKCRASNGRCVR